jgi:hypothetical protein
MAEEILDRYSRNGILIDTNLLILLLIGSLDKNAISTHSRTRAYCPADYDLLCTFIKSSKGPMLTTPNILTETSNITFASLNGDMRNKAMFAIRELTLTRIDEKYVCSSEAVSEPIFSRLGLTDSGIVHLRNLGCVILTVDSNLYVHLSQIGAHVINFNHHRAHLFGSFKPSKRSQ